MTVIAEFTIPAEESPLGETLGAHRDIQFQLRPAVVTDGTPSLRVRADSSDADVVEERLAATPTVAEVRALDEVDGETVFDVSWAGNVDGVIGTIRETDAVLLRGEGRGDDWSFRVRFPGNADLESFYRTLVEKGVPVDLESFHDPLDAPRAGEIDITPKQREALLLALEEGYFEVPRETTVVELAEQLGISDSAVSQRVRRGVATVLSRTIAREE